MQSQVLTTTCDNRRPPLIHPSGLGGGLPLGNSASRMVLGWSLGGPTSVSLGPGQCVDNQGSTTVVWIRMMEKAAMTNDCFFLSFPLFRIALLSAEHGLIGREGSGGSETWCLLIQPHFLAKNSPEGRGRTLGGSSISVK